MKRIIQRFIRNAADKGMVKQAFDTLPEAVCYFTPDGLTELCNIQMYRLCHQIMESDLQTLDELTDALAAKARKVSEKSEAYIFPDGSVWDMSKKNITSSDGMNHIEVIFFDISELYKKRMELVHQTEELERISLDIKLLSENLQEITREKELLSFKTRLHDQLGAGLIAVRRGLLEDDTCDMADGTVGMDESIEILKRAVIGIGDGSMCEVIYETDIHKELENLRRDAILMGTEISVEGDMPDERNAAEIFMIAMRECLTNGIRHAGATHIYAVIEQEDAANGSRHYCLYIKNNGIKPDGPVIPGGGLLNLEWHVTHAGGNMRIESVPEFRLIIELPVRSAADSSRYEINDVDVNEEKGEDHCEVCFNS